MPIYTFYPCKADGVSESFVSLDLVDDAEAEGRALQILDRHASATHVVVWNGERKVLSRHRPHAELRALLSR